MASSLGPVDRSKKKKLNALIKEWKARYKKSGLPRRRTTEEVRRNALAEMWMEARSWLPVWVIDDAYVIDYVGAEDDTEAWERGDMFALGLVLFGRPMSEDGWEVFAEYSGQPLPVQYYDLPLNDIHSTGTPELDALWGIVFDRRDRREMRWQQRQFIAEMVHQSMPADDIVEAYVLLSDEIHAALDEVFPTLLTPVGDVRVTRSVDRYPELKDVSDLLVRADMALGAR